MSMIFQRQYSTNTLLKCLRYQLCCFLLHKISVSPSSSYSWTWWLTGDWRNQHPPHDCSFPSSNLSGLRAFLNKKALVSWSCKLIPCADNVCCVTLTNTLCHPHRPHGCCHGWLCWARPPAHLCRHDVFYLKILQRDWQIKERAGSNREALSDAWNFQITEVMLKELSMFCNQF